jgi:hypothetical protein
MAESLFFGGVFFFLWQSHCFFGGDTHYKLTPTTIKLTPPQHEMSPSDQKTTLPKKNVGVIFFWDGNNLITGGVGGDNLVPPL